MKINTERIVEIVSGLDLIINSAHDLEKKHSEKISRVHPDHSQSAKNLVHYLALRQHDITAIQRKLWNIGLNPFFRIEANVMRNLLFTKMMLSHLIGETKHVPIAKSISNKKSGKLINANSRQLFGKKPSNRRTRIMVTMPHEAATDVNLLQKFIKAGMNAARINCAHDNAAIWLKMIDNIKQAAIDEKTECRIMMDLSGPKLRTGPMAIGPKVVRIKPERDDLGKVTKPAMIWLSMAEFQNIWAEYIKIPANTLKFDGVEKGTFLNFTDARGKNCLMEVIEKQPNGIVVATYDSSYISTGTNIMYLLASGEPEIMATIGELPPVEQAIIIKPGDTIILHDKTEMSGQPATYNNCGNRIKPASLACAMPEIFKYLKNGEPVLFDDGKIEGVIENVSEKEITISILNAKETGSKLRAEKGINFPASDLKLAGLTSKDIDDLKFVAQNADAVNVSFVNDSEVVAFIIEQLQKMGRQPGLILKIETKKGYQNLPMILLEAMQMKAIGIMIARGDLAIETGWNNMAIIQEEILRICEAAHVPDIWATQVLENMAKKGIPSRAEITDAGVSERAECVMLNKGPQITKAIKLLDKILYNMELVNKQEGSLPRINHAEELLLK